MKFKKQFAAAALVLLLFGSFAVPAFDEAPSTEKEEVLYILTDASGQVTDIEAVNIFSGGSILDYGDYSSVKPLNTTDRIEQNGNKISLSSSADRVYYQGTMKNTAIPWNLSLRYFLDGKELSAKELAGKSGALEIRFSVSKNESFQGRFYEEYALQSSFTLSADRCQNLSAPGATIANVGSQKQLTYTSLPGKGLDAVIRADVTDFEMESVAINGVRLNLNLDLGEEELSERVSELISALETLHGGALSLAEGTARLTDAAGLLQDKTGELSGGAGDLTAGAGSLSSGLTDLSSQNDSLTGAAREAYEGLCTASAAALNERLSALGLEPVSLTPETYSAVLTALLEKMDADEVYREAEQAARAQVAQQVEARADELYAAYLSAQADSLYRQAAARAVSEQLSQNGLSQAQIEAYLQTAEGQEAVARTAESFTDKQKEQILAEALASLTEEQKARIREAAVEQLMTSEEVTAQISAAVAQANEAAGEVAALKGQLDRYGAFYQGLLGYTGAVNEAAAGAKDLEDNLTSLTDGTNQLRLSLGELHASALLLSDGAKELADGSGALTEETSKLSDRLQSELKDTVASLSGGGVVESFVSEKNTRVDSVQFVIKTAAIEKAEADRKSVV